MPAPPPDREMTRDQRRRRSGAPPRARRRGRVPSLPLERTPFRPLLDRRRRHEHPGPQPLCTAHRSRLWSGCCRQMDRCRNGSAWRSVGPDPPQSRSPRPARGDGRGVPFPCAAPARAQPKSLAGARATRPRPPAVCSAPGARSQVRKPKPICALAASPVISIGWRCAITLGSGTATPRRRPLSLAGIACRRH